MPVAHVYADFYTLPVSDLRNFQILLFVY